MLPSTTVSFSPFTHSKTTNGPPATENPAVLTGDEVEPLFVAGVTTDEGRDRESVLGP